MSLRLTPLTREQHLDFVRGLPAVSPLQLPDWAGAEPDWRAESLGWLDRQGRTVGAGLVLYRRLPWLGRSLAYLPEGPYIDWSAPALETWLAPLLKHLRARGAFAARMGPPVVLRRWDAAVVRAALTEPSARRLREVPATRHLPTAADTARRLRGMGWRPRPAAPTPGFGAGQPRHVCEVPLAGRSLDDIRRGMNQQWRRNIAKAERAGVKILLGGLADLPVFHALHTETAEREGFTPRPLEYFRRMWTALAEGPPDRVRLYLAHHDGDLLAAALWLRVGGHVRCAYGAATSRRREVRPNNAVQWRMICDAHELGVQVYDLRGIAETLDADAPPAGLLRFKTGMGAEAVEYLGEWDFPFNRPLHRIFELVVERRGDRTPAPPPLPPVSPVPPEPLVLLAPPVPG